MNLKEWNQNYRLAFGLSVMLMVWMLLGVLSPSKEISSSESETTKPFAVQADQIHSQAYQRKVYVRGRTEANRSVLIAAEVDGQVIKTPAVEGSYVNQGDALCVLDSQDRRLRLEQARAQLNKANIEHEGALSLKDRGYQSKTQIATAKANLALAEAEVKAATLAYERLSIRAPFSGVVQERMIDAGGFIQRGSHCARLIELSPLVVVGSVPEADITSVSLSRPAQVRLLDGSIVEGKVRYISKAADETTRTFRVEIEVPNSQRNLVDGLSASVVVKADPISAHHIPPSLLSLNDDGAISLKILEDGNRVATRTVNIVGDDGDGVWVTGLEENTTLITVGHEYVAVDSFVEVAAPASALSKDVSALGNTP